MSLLVRKLGSSAFGSRTGFFLARTFCANAVDAKEIDKLVHNNKVVVFMKGNPEQPRCGFSNAVVQILRMHAVNYDSHDVLQSDALRQGKSIESSG